MRYKLFVFFSAYLRLLPLIGLALIITATAANLDGTEAILIMILCGSPIIYLMSLRCARCGTQLLSVANSKKALPWWSFRIFVNCPECGLALDSDHALTSSIESFTRAPAYSARTCKGLIAFGSCGVAVASAVTIAHFYYGVAIDVGTHEPGSADRLILIVITSIIGISIAQMLIGFMLLKRLRGVRE